jgi:hypothetical protein
MKPKQKNSKRPKMLRISEEMKQWSAMLANELLGWPEVSSRPMFGLMGIYRENAIFAALPRTRAMVTPNSIIFRFDPMPTELSKRAQEDRRVDFERATPGERWFSFALSSADDLRDALWWLDQAYRKAEKKTGGKAKRSGVAPRSRRK